VDPHAIIVSIYDCSEGIWLVSLTSCDLDLEQKTPWVAVPPDLSFMASQQETHNRDGLFDMATILECISCAFYDHCK